MKTNDESKILFPDYTILKPAHEALLAVHFFRSEKKNHGKYHQIWGNILILHCRLVIIYR